MEKITAGFKWLLLLALLAVLPGCPQQDDEPLRIGINAWPGYELLYLAQEKGFYRDEGLEVKLIEFGALSDARLAMERGQIDGAGTTLVEVLVVREHSQYSPQVVQVIDASAGADVILASPAIKDAAALRGANIGMELGSLGVYLLARGLEQHGLKLADVKLVDMDQASMREAMTKGRLAAAVSYPPMSLNIMRDGTAKVIFSSAQIPGEIIDVIAVEAQVIQRRPADVAKLIRAYHQALRYTQQNPAEAYRIMAAREGITPEEFRVAFTDGIHVLSAAEQAAYFKPAGKLAMVMDTTDRILRQNGQIKGADRRADAVNGAFADTGVNTGLAR